LDLAGIRLIPTGSAQDLVDAPCRLAQGTAKRAEREIVLISVSLAAISTFIEVQVSRVTTPPRAHRRDQYADTFLISGAYSSA
jgi:hypothetical protein